MQFPEDFVWGAATSSYQIEGAAAEDGKGPSVWDIFTREPGAIHAGHTGSVACDHYHRYREDIVLMQEIGLQAYRFSVSWPRVLPEGTGALNPDGLGFYDRLVDELLAARIEPYLTLFHWAFPYALYLQGGWLNRDSAAWFADYAQIVADRLSDRVRYWVTINEPSVLVELGYIQGVHAPGLKVGYAQGLAVAHNILRAHGLAARVIRAARSDALIGLAPPLTPTIPASNEPADLGAAQAAMFAIQKRHLWHPSWYMDPVFFGHYPQDGLDFFAAELPAFPPGDMQIIHQPPDFFGANIYQGVVVRSGPDDRPEFVAPPPGRPRTAMNWSVTPQALYWGPRFVWERYNRPVIIMENGLSSLDWVALDGGVHDPQRIDFTTRYLQALSQAIAAGVPVHGYFHWSLMDNFEWAEGYKERFGLIHVDFNTLERTLKDSARWYRRVIASNGSVLEEPAAYPGNP